MMMIKLRGVFLIACMAVLQPLRAEQPVAPPSNPKFEEPKVDAQIFYSEKDPHWADAKKIIDEIEKKYTAVRLERISIDTPAGKSRLSDEENSHRLPESGGDLTFVFGPYAVNSKGERRDVELYMGPMIDRLLDPTVAKGRKQVKVEDYVSDVFGPKATYERVGKEDHDNRYFRVTKDGVFAGYAIDAYRPISCPICGDVQFMIAINTSFTAIDIRPIRELERRGRKLDEPEMTKFLKQFLRQLPRDNDLRVDGISGATKTNFAYEKAMNELISDLKSLEKKRERHENPEDFPGRDN
jgi:hypothetical protein